MTQVRALWKNGLAVLAGSLMVASVVLGALPGMTVHGQPAEPSISSVPGLGSLAGGTLVQVAPATDFNSSGGSGFGSFRVLPDAAVNLSSSVLSVDVNLKPAGDLPGFVDQVSNPASPDYRQFLSAAGIANQFGASSAQYAELESYFLSFGLNVTPIFPGLAIGLNGTGSQIAAAFHTQLSAYQEQYTSNGYWIPTFGNSSGTPGSVSTGPAFYANSLPAELPSGLESMVAGVVGLNDLYAEPTLALPHGMSPGFGLHQGSTGPPVKPKLTLDDVQSLAGGNYSWTNLTNSFVCPEYGLCGITQFLYPSTMHVLTGADNLWDGATTVGGAPDTGQGITVAVVEVGCAIPSDLSTFSREVFGSSAQLNDRLTQIAVNDPTAIVPNTNLSNCVQNGELWGWTGETELDIEYIAALAPSAHIDVIGDPSAEWITNPDDYLKIATYLTTGAECDLAGSDMRIVEGTPDNACSVTITSNSYSIGEQWAYFFAAPEYITVEDQDLLILNAEGVTNFFAVGDDGSNGAPIPGNSFAGDEVPPSSPGGTGVGGGQLTAAGPDGKEFPSGTQAYDSFDKVNQTVVPARAVASFTYWSSGPAVPALGEVGGGFGASIIESQPWWQNSLDSYSAGVRIDPVVSGAAAFNMSSYSFGAWSIAGGTSFATPITAGEWVLIEEQADVAFGSARMGNVNPVLFGLHNAYEAHLAYAQVDPYRPMVNIGVGDDDYAPQNSYTWYYFNLSVNEPSDPVLPLWFPSLANPAGSGWNFLQGLGMLDVSVADTELIGASPSAGHALLTQPYRVLEVQGSELVPITTLAGGTTYTLEVLPAAGETPGASLTVFAYSGGENTGEYGGGRVAILHTSSDGRFRYTPTYAAPALPTNASEYGYFLVQPSSRSESFQAYAVAAPPAQGTLSLCVTDAYGICQESTAEVPMFETVATFPNGTANLYGTSTVELNGVPVADALVTQTVLQSQTGLLNSYLPPSSYAPGTQIGHTISDARGNALFFTAPQGLAQLDGLLETQVYTLQATYGGLTSNSVMVFVEPQSGSTQANLHRDGPTLSGTVLLSDLKYVDFLNVSVGSAPGEFENFTCPIPGAFLGVNDGFKQPAGTVPFPGGVCHPFYDSIAPTTYDYPAGVSHPGIWESGIVNDLVTISLSVSSSNSRDPVVFSLLAGGTNDLSTESCTTTGCSVLPAVQYPLYWSDPSVYQPVGSPTSLLPWEFLGVEAFAMVTVAVVALAVGTIFLFRRRSGRRRGGGK